VYPHNGTTDSYAGDGVSGIYAWCAQVEPGAFSTSPIPTAGAQATRAADVATMALGAWFNASEGTLLGEGTPTTATVSTNQYLAEVSDASGANRLMLVRGVTPSLEAYVVAASVNTPFTGLAVWPAYTSRRVALGYRVNDAAASAGGNAPVTTSSIAVPTSMTTLTIGGSLNFPRTFNGWIGRLRYYRSRLANAQLQGLTQ
jgi:uncharacterized protein (DUF1684 family)